VESFPRVEANQLVTIQEGRGIIRKEKFKARK